MAEHPTSFSDLTYSAAAWFPCTLGLLPSRTFGVAVHQVRLHGLPRAAARMLARRMEVPLQQLPLAAVRAQPAAGRDIHLHAHAG